MFVKIAGRIIKVLMHTKIRSGYQWFLIYCPEEFPDVICYGRLGYFDPKSETALYWDKTFKFNPEVTMHESAITWISMDHIDEIVSLNSNKQAKALLKKE